MRNARLDEAQAGIKILGEISITSDMQMILLFFLVFFLLTILFYLFIFNINLFILTGG